MRLLSQTVHNFILKKQKKMYKYRCITHTYTTTGLQQQRPYSSASKFHSAILTVLIFATLLADIQRPIGSPPREHINIKPLLPLFLQFNAKNNLQYFYITVYYKMQKTFKINRKHKLLSILLLNLSIYLFSLSLLSIYSIYIYLFMHIISITNVSKACKT